MPKIWRTPLCATVLAACVLISQPARSADWPTFGRDPQRTGWAFDEATLSVKNVSNLELKWKTQVKNQPRALSALTAPVVASGVVTSAGVKTLVYVAGTSNNLFALDADTGKVIWSLEFDIHIAVKDPDIFQCYNGITATPTIDRKRNLIYVIAADGRLFGLDLGTGEIRFGPIQFVSPFAKTWSLNLVDDVVYTEISQGCGGAASGIYAMTIDDRLRPTIRNLLIAKTADQGSGAWGRGGPVIGKNRRIYIASGDGEYDPLNGEFANSVIAASLKDLEVTDYFTPHNWAYLNKYDLDISNTHPVSFAYKGYHLLAVGGKEGVVYLMDADALGNKDHQTPLFMTQKLANEEGTFEGKGIWGGLSAWTDEEGEAWVYVPIWGPVSKTVPSLPVSSTSNPHGCIMAFKVGMEASGSPVLRPVWISGDLNVPEPPVIANGVLFALSTGENPHQTKGGADIIYSGQPLLSIGERGLNTTHAILYALDGRTGKVLYESGAAMPTWVHFSGLAVANSQIFAVDHESRVFCFGLAKK
jgi:outer membrane protein assembly factor BamB